MRLNKLILENFRCFEHLELDLHPQLTVLVAENGGGKTAVLDAIKIALAPIMEVFNFNEEVKEMLFIKKMDCYYHLNKYHNMEVANPFCIKVYSDIDYDLPNWSIKTYQDALWDADLYEYQGIRDYCLKLKSRATDEKIDVLLPIFRYFGTGRIWRKGDFTSVAKETEFNIEDYSRLSGYANCLYSELNFSKFSSWFGWVNRSYREEQMDAQEEDIPLSEDGKHFLTIIKVIQGAVDSVTKEATGWHSLQYRSSQNKQLVMRHDENGFIPVEILSDGIRNTIAMVADIAYRACKLNPHLGENAAKETDGIVLIDEVDMFLHPKWQQTILKSLTEAFPKMQFIVTTHSPQVLSTVKRENIRLLPEGKMPLAMTYGEPSGHVMHGVMGVDPQPPVSEKADLQRLSELVNQNQYDTAEAVALMTNLTHTLENHPQLQRLARSIQRQNMLKGQVQS